jgi:hypothetical protein
MREHEHIRLHIARHLSQDAIDMVVTAIQTQYPTYIVEAVQDGDTQGDDIAIEHVGTAYVVEEGDVITKEQLLREFVTGDHMVTIIEPGQS